MERGKGETTENRIRRLTASLQEAAQLITNIESEITARSVLAEKLQKDIETYNKLVELKKPEVEAVAQLLRGELKREGKRSFWTGFALNFLFFTLGVIATIVIEKVVKRRTGT
jgi:t-SNARE complex subunit (syntaxin)